MPNVFYVYFTDAQDVINKAQSANIQPYASTVPGIDDVIPSVKSVFQKDGSVLQFRDGQLVCRGRRPGHKICQPKAEPCQHRILVRR